jgi:hypothetical protein
MCNPTEYQNSSQSLPCTNVCLSSVTLIQKVVDNRAKAMSTAFLIAGISLQQTVREFEEKAVCGRLSIRETLCDSEKFPHLVGGGAVL